MNWIFEAYRDVYALPFKQPVNSRKAPKASTK